MKQHHFSHSLIISGKQATAALRRPVNQLFNAILPTQCLLCDRTLEHQLLCEACRWEFAYLNSDDSCKQCGLRQHSDSNYCGHCLKKPPAFTRTYIPFVYQHPLDHFIHQFKYRGQLTYGKLLSQLLVDHIQHASQQDADWQTPDLLIPTPLYWMRRWQRGFNQAEILAHYLSEALSIPVVTRAVQRTYKTSSQKELTREERQKNLRTAFSLSPRKCEKIKGKKIALIDDVVTTTATVRALSVLLQKAGADDIQVWAIARTLNKDAH